MLQFTANIAGLYEAVYRVKELHCHLKTAYGQEVTIFTRHDDVKMFFIDSEEQSTSEYMDAFNSALVPNGKLGDVLILGAGAGGPARFALEKGATTITQIDIDADIIELAKEYLIEWNKGSLSHPRVNTIIADASRWIPFYSGPKYDTIICDLTELTDASIECWGKDFFRSVLNLLKPGGMFTTHVTWIGNDARARVDELFGELPLVDKSLVPVPAARWQFFYAYKED